MVFDIYKYRLFLYAISENTNNKQSRIEEWTAKILSVCLILLFFLELPNSNNSRDVFVATFSDVLTLPWSGRRDATSRIVVFPFQSANIYVGTTQFIPICTNTQAHTDTQTRRQRQSYECCRIRDHAHKCNKTPKATHEHRVMCKWWGLVSACTWRYTAHTWIMRGIWIRAHVHKHTRFIRKGGIWTRIRLWKWQSHAIHTQSYPSCRLLYRTKRIRWWLIHT